MLFQIAQRKKLVTALKENLGQAGEQVKAYITTTSDIKSKDSTFLEGQPQQDFVDSNGSMSSDATLTENPANPHGPVSQYKGQKLFEFDTESPPPSAAPSAQFPAQSVSASGEKMKAFQFKEKQTANDQPSDGPAVTGSVSSMDEPTPPLAGPNVMNVIIVAAECAPWSKTGGALLLLLLVADSVTYVFSFSSSVKHETSLQFKKASLKSVLTFGCAKIP